MIVRKFLFVVLGLCMYACVSFAYGKTGLPFLSFFNGSETETSAETGASDDDESNTIQVALLLDTSGSMSGLIEQAKSQLWNILNELSRTEKDGSDTKLEIALYEYGNPNKATERNQINQLTPFTTDMDLVSQKLFALTTNGGEEYCGTIIKTSLENLEWESRDGLRMIYIAGNEEFTQGPVSYETACRKANEKDVVINTIFCGDYNEGIKEYWKAGAVAGKGEYLNINHNQETVYVPTPYDDKINELNKELNKTYIPFGKQGKSKKQNQISQDANAEKYSKSNIADRTAFKSSKKYKATDWDLVDAYQKDKNVINKAELVSDTLQALSIDELEQHIQAAAQQRSQIQVEIQSLNEQRRVYKKNNSKNLKKSSLQEKVINSVNNQAKSKGYKIKE